MYMYMYLLFRINPLSLVNIAVVISKEIQGMHMFMFQEDSLLLQQCIRIAYRYIQCACTCTYGYSVTMF